MGRRAAATLVVLIGLLAGWPGAAYAGGGRLAPVKERYDPGEVATVVGYTGDPVLSAVPEEPFYAWLRPAGALGPEWYVGELVVTETGHRGYLRVRVSLTFDVPDDLEPGEYELVYCDDPCTGALLGDLVPSPVSIGVDPVRRVVREWASDDPEIANLDAGALLVGPGYQTTAGELRARAAPAPAPAPVTTVATVPAAAPTLPVAAAPALAPDDGMDWRLPTALVLGAALGTALVLALFQRTAGLRRATRPSPAAGGRRRRPAAGGGRG